MEQTPLPPLVSHSDIDNEFVHGLFVSDKADGFYKGARFVRDIYEADRQRTREVVQALVDALAKLNIEPANMPFSGYYNSRLLSMNNLGEMYQALALAKSQLNIEPTKP